MTTNRIPIYFIFAVILLILSGCTKDKYYTIPLSSNEVTFSNAEGSTTVKCLEGNSFSSVNIVGQGECQQKEDENWYSESCDWLTIKYSLKDRTELEIIVENNTSGKDRTADIEMESPGYYYGSARIKVVQTK